MFVNFFRVSRARIQLRKLLFLRPRTKFLSLSHSQRESFFFMSRQQASRQSPQGESCLRLPKKKRVSSSSSSRAALLAFIFASGSKQLVQRANEQTTETSSFCSSNSSPLQFCISPFWNNSSFSGLWGRHPPARRHLQEARRHALPPVGAQRRHHDHQQQRLQRPPPRGSPGKPKVSWKDRAFETRRRVAWKRNQDTVWKEPLNEFFPYLLLVQHLRKNLKSLGWLPKAITFFLWGNACKLYLLHSKWMPFFALMKLDTFFWMLPGFLRRILRGFLPSFSAATHKFLRNRNSAFRSPLPFLPAKNLFSWAFWETPRRYWGLPTLSKEVCFHEFFAPQFPLARKGNSGTWKQALRSAPKKSPYPRQKNKLLLNRDFARLSRELH